MLHAIPMAIIRLFFHLLILASIFAICRADDADCVYTVYVKTGSFLFQGTDSNISLSLYAANGDGFSIDNLVSWGGLMGSEHDYFQGGNIDIFSGRGPCLTESVCKMNLTSNGQGFLPAWYCDYVDVTTAKLDKNCTEIHFTVDQWLLPLFGLTAIRDYCLLDGKKPMMHGSDLSLVSVV